MSFPYRRNIAESICDACDYTPSDHKPSTIYSPDLGGLIPSRYTIEVEPMDDRYVGRGYINPEAPKRVPRNARLYSFGSLAHSHTGDQT